MRWSIARTTQALVPLCALSCAAGDGVSGPKTSDVAGVSITALPATMLMGDTAQLSVAATDASGRPVEASDVYWRSSDTSVARIGSGGRLVAVGHGTVRVHLLADGRSSSADIAIALTTTPRRLAYAFAHEEAPAGTYQPMRAFAFNATGGGIQVARTATGRYRVTFERLARTDTAFRDVVLVTSYGSDGERCHIDDWGNADNQRDMHAHVACYRGGDASVDSRFTILVVGARSLPGRHGFASVSSSAPETAATAALNTWSSSGQAVAVDRSAPGSYLVHLNAPRTTFPENYFISTVGGAPDLCKISSWNQGDRASVACYSVAGAHTDARFTLLMLEEGRAGKRFGFAWASDPTAPIDQPYAPPAAYQRSSAGIPARVTRTGIGEYAVEFPGLASGGASAEIVQVSPFGPGLTACQLQGWTEDAGATLRAQVRCWNRASNAREDGQFTILVLE